MMKKIVSLSLVMMLVLFFVSTASFADEKQVVETGDFNFTDDFKLIENETIDIKTIHEEPVVKENNIGIEPYASIGYKDFVVYKVKTSDKNLKAMDSAENLTVVGHHRIILGYKDVESWKVDQYGNKLYRVSTTPIEITSARREYDVIPPFTISITTWNRGIGSKTAFAEGQISSTAGGANSFQHYLSIN